MMPAPSDRDWPHDQSYVNVKPSCNKCDSFYGPKRAPSCWQCVSQATREWWLAKFDKEEGD